MNLKLNRRTKKSILIFVDLLLLILGLLLTVVIVFSPVDYKPIHILQFFNIISLQLLVLFLSQVYKAFWKFFSILDLMKLVAAITVTVVVPYLFFAAFIPNNWYHSITMICNWFVLVVLLGSSRLFYRRFSEIKGSHPKMVNLKNTVIIGAGDGGEKLLREIMSNHDLPYRIKGFLDDDSGKKDRALRGVKVLGNISLLSELAKTKEIEAVLVAIPSASDEQMRKILQLCSNTGLEIKTLPSIKYILDGKVNVSQLHDISPDDMLGRESVILDTESMEAMIQNKIIMVSGAGGSIGRELCRQICKFKPQKLILFELTELFLYEIEAELKDEGLIIPIIGDVRNKLQVEQTVEQFKPHIIFHAAAYKHVPMMEKNPKEAVKTNVGGTLVVAKAADKFNVEKFILISTDKAINPTNVMGATKRIAEMIGQQIQKESKTHFITIRFGNVLGSSGSVIPLFKRQISSGGPITVTHPDIKRYFMSIAEAAQLVIQAATYGNGGEIFILDMGEPIKIVDLAKQMITASGLIEGKDIKIDFVGLRPGEKLYEELLYKDEEVQATNNPKVKVARLQSSPNQEFERLVQQMLEPEIAEVQTLLKLLVPEYQPGTNT